MLHPLKWHMFPRNGILKKCAKDHFSQPLMRQRRSWNVSPKKKANHQWPAGCASSFVWENQFPKVWPRTTLGAILVVEKCIPKHTLGGYVATRTHLNLWPLLFILNVGVHATNYLSSKSYYQKKTHTSMFVEHHVSAQSTDRSWPITAILVPRTPEIEFPTTVPCLWKNTAPLLKMHFWTVH